MKIRSGSRVAGGHASSRAAERGAGDRGPPACGRRHASSSPQARSALSGSSGPRSRKRQPDAVYAGTRAPRHAKPDDGLPGAQPKPPGRHPAPSAHEVGADRRGDAELHSDQDHPAAPAPRTEIRPPRAPARASPASRSRGVVKPATRRRPRGTRPRWRSPGRPRARTSAWSSKRRASGRTPIRGRRRRPVVRGCRRPSRPCSGCHSPASRCGSCRFRCRP